MVNFLVSYKRGLDAANQAEANRNEIKSVFNELNEQLDSETGGKLRITIEDREVKLRGLAEMAAANFKPVIYKAVCVANPTLDESEIFELAKWEESECGYPCTMTIRNQKVKCSDKEALEIAIEELLTEPKVGETFQKLLAQ